MKVVEALPSDLEFFFEYLGLQLNENASDNSPLFQPLSKASCYVSDGLKVKFRNGFDSNFGQLGWRKLWVVKGSNERVLGHIDLRHYNEEHRSHRVLVGMGVDSSVRKLGLGKKLLEVVIEFCNESSSIDWLDLNVLSKNLPAKNLYLKCGFEVIGEMSDCYQIDGESVSETTMTICTRNNV